MGGDIKITGKLNDDYMLSVIFDRSDCYDFQISP